MYTSVQNVVARAGEKVLRELLQSGNTLDEQKLQTKIADASVQIDAKLRGRYPVPFPLGSIPPEVELIATTLTYHACFSYRPGLAIPDGLAAEYKAALHDLEQYRKGEMILPGFEAASAHPAFIAADDKAPMFSEAHLNRF